MISYYIQPGEGCWLVMRDGKPLARLKRAHLALALAELMAARSIEHGEEAVFTGIATEPLTPLRRVA